MRLIQNTVQCADRNLAFARHYRGVSTVWPERRTNFTWLPFWLVSTNPAASRRRLISRNGCGLSRANFDLYNPHFGWPSRSGGFKVKLQCFFEVLNNFLLGRALAGNVNLKALRNKPVALTPNPSRKWSLHAVDYFTTLAAF